MQPADGRNLRRSIRVPLVLSADVRVNGVERRFRVMNLSLGGVAVAVDEALPVGAACTVGLLLDGGEETVTCTLEGAVVRNGTGEAGIVFSEVAGLQSLEHLRNLLLYNAKDTERMVEEFGHHLGLRRRD